jgi:hypothetical protein
MSKTIIGYNGKKINKKKLKKFLKKSKKECIKFLKLCGMSKIDIRIAMQTGEAPDFQDIEEFELFAKKILGPGLCDQIGF